MSPSERAAIKGLLGDCRPEIAIEIGTASGGSLLRIAQFAGEVHAFDLEAPRAEVAGLPNVTFHTGDSHALLPRLLARLADRGANVDFVLVDGDHSSEGVRRDVEDLLASKAIVDTLVVLHDTANREVRAGLDAIDYAAKPKVSWVDLDWLPGFVLPRRAIGKRGVERSRDHPRRREARSRRWIGHGPIRLLHGRSAFSRSRPPLAGAPQAPQRDDPRGPKAARVVSYGSAVRWSPPKRRPPPA